MAKLEPLGIPNPEPLPGETFDEFLVVERTYGDDVSNPSIGLANIHAAVPAIEQNKDKIYRACTRFKESGVNIAVFPEFALTGYFWEDEPACRAYMDLGLVDLHREFFERDLIGLLDDDFRAVVLNGLTATDGDGFHNTTFVLSRDPDRDYLAHENSYWKVFLPGIEKLYTRSGRDDRLTMEGFKGGAVGFTTCYDYLFGELLREYAVLDGVDAVIEVASWRAAATRDYPGMNVRTDLYYGELWDMIMAASSATNQVWTIACNAVGRHPISEVVFWGGSGIWAPSGMPMVQASNINEELLIVHNLNVGETRAAELDDFDYAFDFKAIYRPTGAASSFTRTVE
jgi:predicted amidohydrolase